MRVHVINCIIYFILFEAGLHTLTEIHIHAHRPRQSLWGTWGQFREAAKISCAVAAGVAVDAQRKRRRFCSAQQREAVAVPEAGGKVGKQRVTSVMTFVDWVKWLVGFLCAPTHTCSSHTHTNNSNAPCEIPAAAVLIFYFFFVFVSCIFFNFYACHTFCSPLPLPFDCCRFFFTFCCCHCWSSLNVARLAPFISYF